MAVRWGGVKNNKTYQNETKSKFCKQACGKLYIGMKI
jgi:hypothetical protein